MNPGFSSTKGVHISLAQFKEITYVRNSASISLSSTPVGLTSDHSRYHFDLGFAAVSRHNNVDLYTEPLIQVHSPVLLTAMSSSVLVSRGTRFIPPWIQRMLPLLEGEPVLVSALAASYSVEAGFYRPCSD